MSVYNVSVSSSKDFLTLYSQDESPNRYHAIWLRDNAWDSQTRSISNGQRLVAVNDLPVDIKIDSAILIDQTLSVRFLPENKTIDFNINWLLEHRYDKPQLHQIGWVDSKLQTWDAETLPEIPQGDFHQLQTDPSALRQWLSFVQKYGFAKLINGPVETAALTKIVEQFGFVRRTNYGEIFEVRTQLNPSNLAYTGLGLQAHTDNPYRDPAPTLQILYCLENSSDGGENMVVDGFQAAQRLMNENMLWFELLSQYCARFEYKGENGVRLRSKRPIIELAPDGEIMAVRFNNRSAAAFIDVPFNDMKSFYQAYRRLGEILDDPSMAMSFKLEPGESFIVDNTRVLHARKAYSSAGSRWLQGCYADKDGLLSTLACLTETQHESKPVSEPA